MRFLLALVVALSPFCYSESLDLNQLNIKFKGLKNNEVSLKDFKGKLVVVRFWASWCTPCKRDMPILDEFYLENNAKDIEVVGISVDEDISAAKDYLQKNPVHFPIVFNLKNELPQAFAVESFAELYLFDEKGKLIKTLKARPESKEFYSELIVSESK